MTSTELFITLSKYLAGMPVSEIWRGHGSTVFLEMGKLTPTFRRNGSPGNAEGEIGLGVEWSWRIEDDQSIICGSWSDEDRWQPAFEQVKIGHIVSFGLFGSLPEVVLTTNGGMRFVSFSTTEGQPQWSLVDRRHSPNHWFSIRDGRLHLSDGYD